MVTPIKAAAFKESLMALSVPAAQAPGASSAYPQLQEITDNGGV
jgi:hypothetical protein